MSTKNIGIAGPRPSIDFSFIAEYEGANATQGYISASSGKYGGVCVAIGCDLGKLHRGDLLKMSLNPTLKGKLYPYTGKLGQEAADYLLQHPLELSEAETDAINLACKREVVSKLIDEFNEASNTHFCELNKQWQTVLLSLSLQQPNFASQWPEFWLAVTHTDWQQALRLLRQFSPKEAHYIEA